ncbi:MAG: Crp/Fnr family transcriptional regulator [Betaproteobacteria bacterium]|nr:Crp/Fnr family transcriptional regulator [Betaproteobacteria bacterium]
MWLGGQPVGRMVATGGRRQGGLVGLRRSLAAIAVPGRHTRSRDVTQARATLRPILESGPAMSAVDTLKNLAIMLDWTLEERLMLAAKMVEVEVAEGDVLLTENQPAEAAYILKQGRLKITNRGEIVGQVDTVACFGEISCLLPDTPVSATVLAAAPSVVYRISRHDMVDAAQRMPKLWRSLFMQISERLKRVNKRLVEVLAHSPQGFLKLDRDALITNEYSTKCVQYLGREPLAGQSLPEILNAGRPSDVASWQSVFSMVFDDVGVPLSDVRDRVARARGRQRSRAPGALGRPARGLWRSARGARDDRSELDAAPRGGGVAAPGARRSQVGVGGRRRCPCCGYR